MSADMLSLLRAIGKSLATWPMRLSASRRYGRPSTHPEVAAQEVEVLRVHDVVGGEIGSCVVTGIAQHPAERIPQDVEVLRVHDIIAVGISSPHQTEFRLYGQQAGRLESAKVIT